ncbi:MAG: RraA family protein, partial [Candidatus Binatia bacterium]
GGVQVHPGDLLIADGSGVVFIPQAREKEVIAEAEVVAERESRMAEEIRKGRPVLEVMESLGYESMLQKDKG